MRFINPNRVPNLGTAAWRILAAVLMVLLLLEFLVDHHAHFGFEHIPGFYVLWALAAAVGLVIFAILMGRLLKRPENYYDARDNEADDA